jgi:long-chain acyl-CoA synthetase
VSILGATISAVTLPAAEPVPQLATIADLPFQVSGRHPKPLLVGRVRDGKIVGDSTKEWFERLRDLSLGLRALGVSPGDRVAIISESRPEWLLTDLALLVYGAVSVPVYPTLSAAQARYILADSGARIAFVSSEEQLEKVQRIRHELPAIEAIVVFDELTPSSPSVLPFASVIERGHAQLLGQWGVGRSFRDDARKVKPSDLAAIIYTSGTTGEPKGAMLTHGNLASNLLAAQTILRLEDEEVALSFLPLSHAFERMLAYVGLFNGVTIVFAESLETVARDILTVRPTLMTGVPRVYEKFEARIRQKGDGLPQPRRTLFHWGLNVAEARAKTEMRGGRLSGVRKLEAALAERLVWSKIRENVGGRLHTMISGSAPLPPAVAEFFHGIGLPITEGYGLTETSPVLTGNPPSAVRAGTVGRAVPGVEIQVAPDGEILARGPNIMTGYYHKPDETAEVLRDGWFHTGDIGTLDADGYLTITDRKKDLLVTSGGKKIAPQPIEAILKRSPLVSEAILLGDRRKFAAALIVPDFARARTAAARPGTAARASRGAGRTGRRPRALRRDRRRAQPGARAVRAHQENPGPPARIHDRSGRAHTHAEDPPQDNRAELARRDRVDLRGVEGSGLRAHGSRWLMASWLRARLSQHKA